MWNLIWPILLVVLSNVIYHIGSKMVPGNANALASLSVTYLVAFFTTILIYFVNSPTKNLVADCKNLNWTSILLGFAIIGLELGFILVYRAGWNLSLGSLVANIALATVLVFAGLMFYKEQLTLYQVIGMVLCVAGLIFINLD